MYLQLKKLKLGPSKLGQSSSLGKPTDDTELPTLRRKKRTRSEVSGSSGDDYELRPSQPPSQPLSQPSSHTLSQPSSQPLSQPLSQPSSAGVSRTSSASPLYQTTYDHSIRARRSKNKRAKEQDAEEVKILEKLTSQVDQTLAMQQQMQSAISMEQYNERLMAHKYFGQLSLRIDHSVYDDYRREVQDVIDRYV